MVPGFPPTAASPTTPIRYATPSTPYPQQAFTSPLPSTPPNTTPPPKKTARKRKTSEPAYPQSPSTPSTATNATLSMAGEGETAVSVPKKRKPRRESSGVATTPVSEVTLPSPVSESPSQRPKKPKVPRVKYALSILFI